jgi:hypothetical protein
MFYIFAKNFSFIVMTTKSYLLQKKLISNVATLALGLQPRQKGHKVTGQEEA